MHNYKPWAIKSNFPLDQTVCQCAANRAKHGVGLCLRA